jgi:hypothetical protein
LVVLSGLLIARVKEQAPKTERAGSNLPMSILLSLREETWGKGIAGLITAEARLGQRRTTAFFGEANALLPGQGTNRRQGESLIRRTH